MAIKMDGNVITELELHASDGTTTTKQLIEELNLQQKTATVNGDVTPDNGYDGLSKVVVNVPAPEINLQNKTANANGEVTADEGYDGLGVVTVAVSGDAPTYQEKTVNENGVVLPDAGYDAMSKVTVNVSGGGGTAYHHGTIQIDSKVSSMSIPVDISAYDCYFVQLIVKRTGVGAIGEVTWDETPTVPASTSNTHKIVPAFQCAKGIQQNVQINNDGTLAWVRNNVFCEMDYLHKGGTNHIVNTMGAATVAENTVTISDLGTNNFFGVNGYVIEYEYDIFAFNAN